MEIYVNLAWSLAVFEYAVAMVTAVEDYCCHGYNRLQFPLVTLFLSLLLALGFPFVLFF